VLNLGANAGINEGPGELAGLRGSIPDTIANLRNLVELDLQVWEGKGWRLLAVVDGR
jgi:hypothetical protein